MVNINLGFLKVAEEMIVRRGLLIRKPFNLAVSLDLQICSRWHRKLTRVTVEEWEEAAQKLALAIGLEGTTEWGKPEPDPVKDLQRERERAANQQVKMSPWQWG